MKKDNKMIVLNIILLILNLILIGITCYKTFIYDDKAKNNDNIKNNNDTNKSSIYSFNNIDEMNQFIYEMNYGFTKYTSNHINNYDDFVKAIRSYYLLEKIMPNVKLNLISKVESTEAGTEHQDDKTDSLGNVYPEYPSASAQFVAKDFGLSVPQIEKIDEKYWPSVSGYYHFELYDTNAIKERFPTYYEEIFSNSFVASSGYYSPFGGDIVFYNKNLDMIVLSSRGGTAEYLFCDIVEMNKTDNEYIVKVAYAFLIPDAEEYHMVAEGQDGSSPILESHIKRYGVSNSELIQKHLDKLNKYEVKFIKKDGKWTLHDVKTIYNN